MVPDDRRWLGGCISSRCTGGVHAVNIFRLLLISQFRVCRRQTYRDKLLTYRALFCYSEKLHLIQENIMNMPTPLTVLSSHLRFLLPLEESPVPREAVFCVNGFRKLLELLQKIVKEEYSGDADCELRMVVLSGAKDSVTDDI